MAFEINTSKIGERIKELKKIKKLKQDDLINLTGTSRVTISNYEQGKVKPPIDFLMKLSAYYDVSMDWLCGLSDNTGGRNIETYADLFAQLQVICQECNVEISTWTEECGGFYNNSVEYYKHLRIDIDDNLLASSFEEYDEMRNLKDKHTINEHLFNLWLEDKLNTLSCDFLPKHTPAEGDLPKHTPSEDDLPF